MRLCAPRAPPCAAVQNFDYALVRRSGNTEQVIAQVGRTDLRDTDAVTVEVSVVNTKWYLRVRDGRGHVLPCQCVCTVLPGQCPAPSGTCKWAPGAATCTVAVRLGKFSRVLYPFYQPATWCLGVDVGAPSCTCARKT